MRLLDSFAYATLETEISLMRMRIDREEKPRPWDR